MAPEDVRIGAPVRITYEEVTPEWTLMEFEPAPAAAPAQKGERPVEVDLSEEQRFLQERHADSWSRSRRCSTLRERAGEGEPPFDRNYWQRAAELGWTAMLIPEEHGGAASEHPVLDLIVVAEEIGRQHRARAVPAGRRR